MNASCCCQRKPRTGDDAREQKNWLGRVKEIARWILPSALLALMPKCPLCLAAYVALCTGFTMSGSSAHVLMRTLTAVCIGTLALCVVRRVAGWRQSKQTFNLQLTPTQQ